MVFSWENTLPLPFAETSFYSNFHIDNSYLLRYTYAMYIIKESEIFSKWLLKLKDTRGKVSILRRIKRVTQGNFGDHKSVGDSVSELRITTGPGYRVYYTQRGEEIIILLIGGDKSSQSKDIEKAKELAKEYQDEQ